MIGTTIHCDVVKCERMDLASNAKDWRIILLGIGPNLPMECTDFNSIKSQVMHLCPTCAANFYRSVAAKDSWENAK